MTMFKLIIDCDDQETMDQLVRLAIKLGKQDKVGNITTLKTIGGVNARGTLNL